MAYERFYDLVKFLKTNVHPFKLRRVCMPKGIDGDCFFDGKDFIIRIEKNLAEYYAIECLIHEAGHISSFDKELDDHGPKWGKSYSAAYRKFLEWNETHEKK